MQSRPSSGELDPGTEWLVGRGSVCAAVLLVLLVSLVFLATWKLLSESADAVELIVESLIARIWWAKTAECCESL